MGSEKTPKRRKSPHTQQHAEEPISTKVNSPVIESIKVVANQEIEIPNMIEEAIKAFQAKNWKLAESIYRSILDEHPHHLQAETGLSRCLAKQGHTAEAIALLGTCAANLPKNRNLWVDYGNMLREHKSWEEAESAFVHATNIKPDNRDWWPYYALGEVRLSQEKWSEALEPLKVASEWEPDFFWIHFAIAKSHFKLERYLEAIPVLEKCLEIDPTNEVARSQLAICLKKSNPIQFQSTASWFFSSAIEKGITNPDVFQQIAKLAHKENDWHLASLIWFEAEKFATTDSDKNKYYDLWVRSCIEVACIANDWQTAASKLQDWLAKQETIKLISKENKQKDNPNEANDLGVKYWLSKPDLDVYQTTRKLASLDGVSKEAIRLHAEISFALTRWQDAKDSYFRIIDSLNSEDALRLGEICERASQPEEAFSYYLKSWSFNNDEQSFKKLLSITQVYDLKSGIPDLYSNNLTSNEVANLFNYCDTQDESKNADSIIFALAARLPIDVLCNTGNTLWLLLKSLPEAFNIAELEKNWTIIFRWLEAIERSEILNGIPDWLAVEILWMANQLNTINNETAIISPKNHQAKKRQFNGPEYLKKLYTMKIWEQASKFDEAFNFLDSDWINTQGDYSKESSTIEALSAFFNIEETKHISPHPLFDVVWYKKTNMINAPEAHPVVHFFRYSSTQRKDSTRPNPYFDCDWYRNQYLTNENNQHPLLHYLSHFKDEGISPSQLFHNDYIRELQGLDQSQDPLAYYMEQIRYGGREFRLNGFNTSPWFDRQFYLAQYADIKIAAESELELDPVAHAILIGFKEGRQTNCWHTYQQFVKRQLLHFEPFNFGSSMSEGRFGYIKYEMATKAYLANQQVMAKQLSLKPKISVIVPVFQVKPKFLKEMIESVVSQTYENWQLCIVDDASIRYKDEIHAILETYSNTDPRIVYKVREKNGHICHSSNDCLSIADGEFIALLDHDDLLTPDALYEMAKAINADQAYDIIYSDEDKVDEWGLFYGPYYKPDWSPHTLWGKMYVCHLTIYRKSLIEQVGGFRPGFEGSQDYDLLLRTSAIAQKIHHIPKVLYHWRAHAESTAGVGNKAKSYCAEAGRKAVEEALKSRGIEADVSLLSEDRTANVVKPDILGTPKVDIIIPTRNGTDILSTCLNSIFEKSTYKNFLVTVVDNGSSETAFFELMEVWQQLEPSRFQVLRDESPFNFSVINNNAVKKTNGEFLLFLNNDTEVIAEDWIEGMLGYAQLPEIGAVGAKLLYPDDTIQHAGVITGIGGVAGHAMKGLPRNGSGYFSNLELVTDYSAVTAACLMLSREKFNTINGFEEHLKVAFNDIDFCLKLREKGLYNVYLPFVELYHYESKSRGHEDTPTKQARSQHEVLYMRQRWGRSLDLDPFYSPWLTLTHENMNYRFH